ncbi:DUF2075 domain-containing protein [Companilactobacillus mishanensis]|uniref:DUF2075 domain-containing protein n=1 Tax=Companilactobacillus mishanensis TaxID=2486008 RepID=UPI0012981B72|nr:DUF2075 domain-containing protein [Companilactobacillus mishanensis]MQS89681.1 DUF2075 domain-containing protein [Companilactobacillus mishanensis]
MVKISAPIIRKFEYSQNEIQSLDKEITNEKDSKLLLRYPTIYIVNDQFSDDKYSIYVGETTDIKRRSLEHLQNDSKEDAAIDESSQKFWQDVDNSKDAEMYLIGHEHFNKSLTLDIENKLIHYMSGIDKVDHLYNRRTNQQEDYYTSDELNPIFSKIWNKLRNDNRELFPLERVIRDSAIFKASPFHKLTKEQFDARDQIIMKIEEALNRNKEGQLILVSGEAGSGKTVLLSSLFYELSQLSTKNGDNKILEGSSQYLLVNHDQQLKVYEQIIEKLGLSSKDGKKIVTKPTMFLNEHESLDKKADVILVDEAHLLWTQGKQAYRGENQLQDLLDRAKVVVAIFDENQILSREQYVDENEMRKRLHEADLSGNYIRLENQMRMHANPDTIGWIRNVIDKHEIFKIPTDHQYDLKVFDSPENMFKAIADKSKNQESGISRMLATFDWEYIDKKKPENEDYWNVKVGDFSMPWNLQLPETKEQKLKNRNLAWAEQEQTINEIGSTFTIQGFDLNYAGVIIGPSVKYRDGKIIFDKKCSKNKKATQRRTYNGKKLDISDRLLNNELNVLLTRGVNGLYIYAVDEQLQRKLMESQEE